MFLGSGRLASGATDTVLPLLTLVESLIGGKDVLSRRDDGTPPACFIKGQEDGLRVLNAYE